MTVAIGMTWGALAACSPPAQSPAGTAAENPSSPAPAAGPIAPKPVGRWRLVEMNGRAAPTGEDAPPILMTVGRRTLAANSQCVGFWRRYERQGARLTVSAYGPVVMCARGFSDWERSFDAALDQVTTLRVEPGRLHLTGDDAALTFVSEPVPAPTDFQGRWTLRRLGGKAPASGSAPIEMTVAGDRIDARSQCLAYGWALTQTGALIELTPRDVGPVCERGRSEWETQFERAMDAVDGATLLPDGTLVLHGGISQAEFDRLD